MSGARAKARGAADQAAGAVTGEALPIDIGVAAADERR
jgi:hypothetical protein